MAVFQFLNEILWWRRRKYGLKSTMYTTADSDFHVIHPKTNGFKATHWKLSHTFPGYLHATNSTVPYRRRFSSRSSGRSVLVYWNVENVRNLIMKYMKDRELMKSWHLTGFAQVFEKFRTVFAMFLRVSPQLTFPHLNFSVVWALQRLRRSTAFHFSSFRGS